jgi:hypothetical protein
LPIADCQFSIRVCDGGFFNRQLAIGNQKWKMTPKEIAAHYEAKVFESPEAAKVAGFVLTETASPRNVWNKASAAQAIVLKLAEKRANGVAKEIGLIIEPWSVTGCYLPDTPEPAAA